MRDRRFRRRFTLLATGLLVIVATAAVGPGPATRPRYTADGKLEAPEGYHSWVFVGADLSPQYRADLEDSTPREQKREQDRHEDQRPGAFHNIYINREAYDEYVKTRKFPDPTILVMEVFRAAEKDDKGVLARGRFEAERIGLEAAVKDTKRPGGGKDWAYYDFDVRGKSQRVSPAAAFPDEMCYTCHLHHASVDNVWVQFYPVLRDLPPLDKPR
jgi:Cytochrome P460